MAQPIPLEPRPRDPRQELDSRLRRAPIEHAEALLAGYEVLQALHDSGVLELLRGVLGSREQVWKAAVDAARTPGSTRLLRNLITIVKTLAGTDPDLFNGFARAFPEAMRQAKGQGKTSPGLLSVLNELRREDLRRGLVAVNSLLKAWGRNCSSETQTGG